MRTASATWLHAIPGERLAEVQPLATALVNSPTLREAAYNLIRAIERADQRLPALLLETCQRLCVQAEAGGSDWTRAGSWNLSSLPALLVRGLREMDADDPNTDRWLDMLDRLVLLRVPEVDRQLAAFDR